MSLLFLKLSAEFPFVSNEAGDGYLVSAVHVDDLIDLVHVDVHGILHARIAGLEREIFIFAVVIVTQTSPESQWSLSSAAPAGQSRRSVRPSPSPRPRSRSVRPRL